MALVSADLLALWSTPYPRHLGLLCIVSIFKKYTLFFRVTEKLNRRYKIPRYPLPHCMNSFPHYQHLSSEWYTFYH